jgi:hypothetical protein
MAHSSVRLVAAAVTTVLLPQLAAAHPALNLGQLDSIDTEPTAPVFLDYVNHRSFTNDGGEGGDVGPEGLPFIAAHESPNRQPLLVVTSEIRGNVSTYVLDSGRR